MKKYYIFWGIIILIALTITLILISYNSWNKILPEWNDNNELFYKQYNQVIDWFFWNFQSNISMIRWFKDYNDWISIKFDSESEMISWNANLNLLIIWKNDNSNQFESFVNMDWDIVTNISNTDNLLFSWMAQLRYVSDKLFLNFNSLEFDTKNPRFLLIKNLIQKYWNKWILIWTKWERQTDNIVTMKDLWTRDLYYWLSRIIDFIKLKPILEWYDQREELGFNTYSIALNKKNLLEICKNISDEIKIGVIAKYNSVWLWICKDIDKDLESIIFEWTLKSNKTWKIVLDISKFIIWRMMISWTLNIEDGSKLWKISIVNNMDNKDEIIINFWDSWEYLRIDVSMFYDDKKIWNSVIKIRINHKFDSVEQGLDVLFDLDIWKFDIRFFDKKSILSWSAKVLADSMFLPQEFFDINKILEK